MFETKEILKQVRAIEIKTRRLSNHLFSGEYHSSFKGRGMSFSEVREYQYGDDVRAIDWNVSAKFQKPFIKVFEEERELTLMLLVDVSGSEIFGTKIKAKHEMITEICAVLAFSAIQNNDKVGVIFFSDKVEKYIPPKKGKSHILRIIRDLVDFKPQGNGTNISEALKYMSNVVKKKSIAFLLSDFMDQDYMDTLRYVAKKHDLTGIRVCDQHEEELPKIGLVKLLDPETKEEIWVDTMDQQVQNNYAAYFNEQSRYFKDAFLKSGSGKIDIRTHESYVKKLMAFFKQRS